MGCKLANFVTKCNQDLELCPKRLGAACHFSYIVAYVMLKWAHNVSFELISSVKLSLGSCRLTVK